MCACACALDDRLGSDVSVGFEERARAHHQPVIARALGELRYRPAVDADAGNGSERACPPADLFTEVQTEMTDCLPVSCPECNFCPDD